jgi:hypothetical protein
MYNSSKTASASSHHYHHQQQSTRSDRCREIMSIDNLLTPQKSQLSVQTHKLQPASPQVSSPSASDSAFERTPREKREPYSDQAQFYIIFVRVGKEKDWNQIERSFEEVFGDRRLLPHQKQMGSAASEQVFAGDIRGRKGHDPATSAWFRSRIFEKSWVF